MLLIIVVAEFYYVTIKSTVLIFYVWPKTVLDDELGGMRVGSALQVIWTVIRTNNK